MTRRKEHASLARDKPVPDFWKVSDTALDALKWLAAEAPVTPRLTWPLYFDNQSAVVERYAYLAMEYATERRIEPENRTESKARLEAIHKHGTLLLDDLRRSRRATVDALNAFRLPGQTLGRIEADLAWRVDAATRAEPHGKNHKGPARAESARKIVRQASRDFFSITGQHLQRSPRPLSRQRPQLIRFAGSEHRPGRPKRPATGPKFVVFLRKIFAACEIREIAVSFEQEAVEEWNSIIEDITLTGDAKAAEGHAGLRYWLERELNDDKRALITKDMLDCWYRKPERHSQT
jgi:hypothetical protein